MPRVPTLQPGNVPIAQKPKFRESYQQEIPGEAKDTSALLGTIGKIGKVALSVEIERAQSIEEAKTLEAFNLARNSVLKVSTDIQERKGKAAITSSEDFARASSDIRKQITKDLSGESLNIFNKAYNNLESSHLAQAYEHEVREGKIYAEGERVAERSGILGEAMLSADPAVIELKRKQYEASLMQSALANDYGPENAVLERKKGLSTFHTSMYDKIVDSSPTEALAYIERYKEDLEPAAYDKLLKHSRPLMQEEQMYFEVGRIASANVPLPNQLKMAEEIKEPKIKALVMEQLERRNRTIEYAKAQEREESLRQITDQLMRNPDMVPPFSLDPEVRFKALAIKKQLQERSIGSERSSPEVYSRLNQMAATNPEEFKKTNLLDPEIVGRLTPADFKHFDTAQAALRAGKTPSQKFTWTATKEKIIGDQLNLLGIQQNPNKSKKGAELAAQFRQAVALEVEAWEGANAKQISPADFTKIVQRQALPVASRWGGLARPVALFEATPDKELNIPGPLRDSMIKKYVEKYHTAPSDEWMQSEYRSILKDRNIPVEKYLNE